MFVQLRLSVIAAALLTLSACGGGAPTAENPVTSPGTANSNTYSGPPPATADIQAFKLNLWDNLQSDDRCGTCHKPSQTPRFVRADDRSLTYSFTMTDPTVWAKPWRAEVPMTRIDGFVMEYACHEGNYAMRNILGIARQEEAAGSGR